MQVTVAKSAGFCFGVQRAVDTVYEQVEKGIRPIYTYGPIIHNEVVVQDLEERGVQVLEGKEDLGHLTEGTVIIRSHGVGKEIYDLISAKGLNCVDATCPFVKKIHRTVEKESAAGRQLCGTDSGSRKRMHGEPGFRGSRGSDQSQSLYRYKRNRNEYIYRHCDAGEECITAALGEGGR